MSAHVLPPLAVNSKSERKVDSLPPLGFELVIIGMLAHLSHHSTKSHQTETLHSNLSLGKSYVSICYIKTEKITVLSSLNHSNTTVLLFCFRKKKRRRKKKKHLRTT
jgi:hypothetical protein